MSINISTLKLDPKFRDYIKAFFKRVKINPNNQCWEWSGIKTSAGYGMHRLSSKPLEQIYAHRFSHEFFKGQIPKGMHTDHLCRNRKCVNPKHLEVVTPSQNTKRGIAPELLRKQMQSLTHEERSTLARVAGIESGKLKQALTHCKRGHEFAGENTKRTPSGHRFCVLCRRAYDRLRRPSKKVFREYRKEIEV